MQYSLSTLVKRGHSGTALYANFKGEKTHSAAGMPEKLNKKKKTKKKRNFWNRLHIQVFGRRAG
jgi:hypothetical protein